MSSEHQRYSLKDQADAIAAYAETNGYETTRTYFDPGKSGLTLKQRPGLQALLAAVLDEERDFDAILVLDISRWGRFQDMDQSAYYEFLCRSAGLDVIIYCAEPFDNDGTPLSSIVKQIKRIMAAEYSRELSDKVSFARRRHAELGHHQGGPLPYGFRRISVDAAGQVRALLESGHLKPVTTDHVILAPGPPEEQKVIERIFRRYAIAGRGMRTIAAELNRENISPNRDGPWSYGRIRSVLMNELVIGNYAFAKTRVYLRSPRRHAPPDTWVRVRVFDPVISPHLFRKAEKRRLARAREMAANTALLAGLRRLWRERGSLSVAILKECPYVPCAQTFRNRFGKLSAAYAQIGYDHRRRTEITRETDDKLLIRLRNSFNTNGFVTFDTITRDETLPSYRHLYERFGSLIRAYELAGLPHDRGELVREAHRRAVRRGTARISKYSNEELLAGLRRLRDRDGYVCTRTVDADPNLPGHGTYAHRFGSWLKAVDLAGLPADRHTIAVSTAARRGLKIRKSTAP
jgi:DNA invertase Pin-like site-specific DNA recombinase